jgi:hypothetical protein
MLCLEIVHIVQIKLPLIIQKGVEVYVVYVFL